MGWSNISEKERFWRKVKKTKSKEECWVWQAAKGKRGYGRFGVGTEGKTTLAHRYAYESHYKIRPPKNLCVLHDCDNPPCCNPFHLFLGTRIRNNRDMKTKGRHAFGKRNGQAKLSESKLKKARSLYESGKYLQKEVAAIVGVSQGTLSVALRGLTWNHITKVKGN